MARQYACGGEAPAFPINPHFEYPVEGGVQRCTVAFVVSGAGAPREFFVALTPGVNPVATG